VIKIESLLNKQPGTYIVSKINSRCRKLHELGIIPGTKITLLSAPKCGQLILLVGHTKVAIGRGMASKIIVE